MARAFISEEDQAALLQAVVAVERASAAEIVVSIRGRSGSYLHADLTMGIAAGIVTLVFLLFSPWPFRLPFFAIDPIIAGALTGLLTSRSTLLRRWLTSPRVRREQVARSARAAFVDRGVHRTKGRTGILVYASLLENVVEVVPDIGVEEAVPDDAWTDATAALIRPSGRWIDATRLAEGIEALAPALAEALPRAADDENELPDEVRVR